MCGDLRELVAPVLRHRILLTVEGQAEGITTDAIVRHLLESLRA